MNIVEQIIKDIEEELYNSTQTRYTCKDGTKIATDVGYVEEWFKQYKDILRKRYRNVSDVKELNHWGLGGNQLHPEEGCNLTLYNEDEQGNEYDSVAIHLKPKDINMLIRCLEMYREKEE